MNLYHIFFKKILVYFILGFNLNGFHFGLPGSTLLLRQLVFVNSPMK